jgi:hypothetical protein
MAAIALNQLNLFSLPSVDINAGGWASVGELPTEPGCYAIAVRLAGRRTSAGMTQAERSRHSKAIVWALGHEVVRQSVEAVERGNEAMLTLYIGYSKNLQQRWAGRSPHHKQDDIRAVVHLLGLFFDVRSLHLHYLLASDGDKAKRIEGYLIRLWKPALNERAPLVVTSRAA